MSKAPMRYPIILFDWGDTVMRDDLALTTPMVEWSELQVIEDIADVLEYLHFSGRQILLATSASVSDEDQIRGALARVGLDRYFLHIFCFKNTHLAKSEAFYKHILSELDIPAADVLMVGDSFEKDVQAANAAGIFAVWFNPISDENLIDELHTTVHSMQELGAFFQALDRR